MPLFQKQGIFAQDVERKKKKGYRTMKMQVEQQTENKVLQEERRQRLMEMLRKKIARKNKNKK